MAREPTRTSTPAEMKGRPSDSPTLAAAAATRSGPSPAGSVAAGGRSREAAAVARPGIPARRRPPREGSGRRHPPRRLVQGARGAGAPPSRPQVVTEVGAEVAADPADQRQRRPGERKRHEARSRRPGHGYAVTTLRPRQPAWPGGRPRPAVPRPWVASDPMRPRVALGRSPAGDPANRGGARCAPKARPAPSRSPVCPLAERQIEQRQSHVPIIRGQVIRMANLQFSTHDQ